jgi:hypothetical protein
VKVIDRIKGAAGQRWGGISYCCYRRNPQIVHKSKPSVNLVNFNLINVNATVFRLGVSNSSRCEIRISKRDNIVSSGALPQAPPLLKAAVFKINLRKNKGFLERQHFFVCWLL